MSRHCIGKMKVELYLSTRGAGRLASQEWLIFLVSMISGVIKIIIIHQICFQPCRLQCLVCLDDLWHGPIMSPRTQLSCCISFCWWLGILKVLHLNSFSWCDPPSPFLICVKPLALKNTLRSWKENLKSKYPKLGGWTRKLWPVQESDRDRSGTCGLPFQQIYRLHKSETAANFLYSEFPWSTLYKWSFLCLTKKYIFWGKWNMTLRFFPFYDFNKNCEIGFKSSISL